MTDRTYLILGGAGLVGFQIARSITEELTPGRVVLVSRTVREVDHAVRRLQDLYPGVTFTGRSGDILLRSELSQRTRRDLLDDREAREAIFEDLLGPIDNAYRRSWIAELFEEFSPEVVVDSINTATAISYQDAYTASILARRAVTDLRFTNDDSALSRASHDVEALILSQAVPQLIRHVLILHRAMVEHRTELYLKVGTTGTGGMGLNIPYTHSEDRPSAPLLTKTSVAFAHTGLLFLAGRTAEGPIIKELKPAAMIGYDDVGSRPISEGGEPVTLFESHQVPLDGHLVLRLPTEQFAAQSQLQLPVVSTGENGVFTRGEFDAITTSGQMEFTTPEEIARTAVQEIKGGNTGYDVIAALDGSVMGPTYRAGLLRGQVLTELESLEESSGTHSVALGQLGPPELSKLLWEAELLKLEFGTLTAVLEALPESVAGRISAHLSANDQLRNTITSIGLPILDSDGKSIIRGPRIRIPEVRGASSTPIEAGSIDQWAAKGWVDLRPDNWARWQARFAKMRAARSSVPSTGSGAFSQSSYQFDDIVIGAVVGWVFVNEIGGFRIK